MNLLEWPNEDSQSVISALVELNVNSLKEAPIRGFGMKERVTAFISHLECALFPTVFESSETDTKYLGIVIQNRLNSAAALLDTILCQTLSAFCDKRKTPDEECDECALRSRNVTKEFIDQLPKIREALKADIQSAFDGDPAAKSTEEIMLSYPCFEAIMIYRMAHELWIRDVPILPRMMSEQAHSHTGIDIHPGASIGERFFIDHGTGVVIGETTVIGKNVKLYQGVTLGAKSFLTDEKGTILAIKRHPNIEDNVIVYAHATILGGETTIGHDSIIGGNVWLTNSVPPNSYVYNTTPNPKIKDNNEAR